LRSITSTGSIPGGKNSDDYEVITQTGNLKDVPKISEEFQEYLEANPSWLK
jgi:hypothetical protein